MAKDVKVTIELQKVIPRLGFGYPLILCGKAESPIPYTECSDIDEVEKLYTKETATYKSASLLFRQTNRPSKIAVASYTETALEAIKGIMNKEWRQLVVLSLGTAEESTMKEIADYLETKKDKMFFVDVKDVSELSVFTTKDYNRTVAFCYKHNEEYPSPVCALIGETASKEVGSFTYKNQILLGLPPMEYTDDELEAIHEAGAITFVTKAGDNVTSEGKTLSGEYIDIVDSEDWLIQQIEYKVQKTFNNYDKVPYDNIGINVLESPVVTVLKEAYENGMIAVDEDGLPDYWTDFAKREETDEADRVVRRYIGGEFGFALAGAIHQAEIKGVIEV